MQDQDQLKACACSMRSSREGKRVSAIRNRVARVGGKRLRLPHPHGIMVVSDLPIHWNQESGPRKENLVRSSFMEV